jgi:hypothetical protein
MDLPRGTGQHGMTTVVANSNDENAQLAQQIIIIESTLRACIVERLDRYEGDYRWFSRRSMRTWSPWEMSVESRSL